MGSKDALFGAGSHRDGMGYGYGDVVIERIGDNETATKARTVVVEERIVRSGPNRGIELVKTRSGHWYHAFFGMGRSVDGGSAPYYRSIRKLTDAERDGGALP